MSNYSNMVDYNPYNHTMDKLFVKPKPYYNVPPNFYPNNYNNLGGFNNSSYNSQKTPPQNLNRGVPPNYYNYTNSCNAKAPYYNHNNPSSTYNNINNQHIKYAPCASTANNFNNNYESKYYKNESNNYDQNDKYYSSNISNNIPKNTNYHFCSKTYNTLNNQPYSNSFNNQNNIGNANKSNHDSFQNYSSQTYDNEAAFTQNANNTCNDFYNHNDYINHVCNDSHKDIPTSKVAQFLSTSSCNPVVPPGCILLYDHKNITNNGSDINYNINNGAFILSAGHCYLLNIYVSGFTSPFNKLFFIMLLNGCATGATPIKSEAINSYNSAAAHTIITTTTNTTLQILNATNGLVKNVTSSISIFEIC